MHRVPLSLSAMDVLAEVMPLMKRTDDLVFPGRSQGRPLSDRAVSEVVRRMNEGGEEGATPRWRDAEGRAVVPHGFRSTFRDWAGETRPEGREVVEAALAHTIKDKAEAAYARSDLLEKRRPLMDAWAEHCVRPTAEVVQRRARHAEAEQSLGLVVGR
jgi:integrase